MNLRFWFWDQLPPIFKELDTYKDNTGRGLFERYCEIFGLEYDNEVIPKIEDYTEITDVMICEEKFIKHLAYTLGQPPNFFNSIPLYRKILSFILSIYKIKGTLKSYQIFFGYLGYQIYLALGRDECTLYDDPEILYDNDESYDTCCLPCVDYSIVISNKDAECLPSTDPDSIRWNLGDFVVTDEMTKILCFIEPIDINLVGFVPGIFCCETVKVSVVETVTVQFLHPRDYDDVLSVYDIHTDYDDFLITNQYNYP